MNKFYLRILVLILVPIVGILILRAFLKPNPEVTFTQFPGFTKYYENYPPQNSPPLPDEKVLLRKYLPRFFLPPNHPGAIDFYRDYIAQGRLVDAEEKLVVDKVDQEVLNKYRRKPGFQFIHEDKGEFQKLKPVVYGRIDYDTLKLQDKKYPFTFLTYHIVFRTSGLPAGVPQWQQWFLNLIASTTNWHQLDHYTAVTLALDDNKNPVAVTMQQHNYLTTYLIGKNIQLPSDNRVKVDVAIASNELYPHKSGRVKRRAASFMTPEAARYIIFGTEKPFLAAEDITHGVGEINYNLEFLPQTDAFYTFQGRLGIKRSLPGRDAPPGSDYNTLPALKPKALTMIFYYRRENDSEFIDLLEKASKTWWNDDLSPELVEAFGKRFVSDWQKEK